jgi:7,8-dihydropterin-6-yl-methyl-4-(beta-D-ribofuranosyl)aminobenzene 5'-phosphate synthase
MHLGYTFESPQDNGRELELSVLCDDTVMSDEFVTEHGLSILALLPNGHRWLIDTGATDVYLDNARRMGVDMDNLTGIAVTHGHDDHTGGLIFYPRLKGTPPVYGHPYIWNKSYQIKEGKPVRITGMTRHARQYVAPAFRSVNGVVMLDEDFYFFTDIPRESGSFAPTQGNFLNEDGTGPCPIIDDATIVVKTGPGLVVIFGCAHAGYSNILKAVHRQFPDEKLRAIVGGLHFMNADDAAIEEAAAFTKTLKSNDFSFYGGHCTGDNPINCFREIFGRNAVKPLGAGRVIRF